MKAGINPIGGLILGTSVLGIYLLFGARPALWTLFAYGLVNIGMLLWVKHAYNKHVGKLEQELASIISKTRASQAH